MASTSSSDLRTSLAKAKGLGSAHHGFSHWWVQRLTAMALIPLSLWFVYELLNVMLAHDIQEVRLWFKNGFNASMMVLMLGALFYHAKLGVQVVIEDYVKAPVIKYGLLLANTFICFIFGAISILAVLRLHFI